MIIELLIRCKDVESTIKVKVQSDDTVKDIINLISEYLDLTLECHKLFFNGIKMSPDKNIHHYSISNGDLLLFSKSNNKNVFFSSIQPDRNDTVSAEKWLVSNIGLSEDELKLETYKKEDEKVNIVYRCDDLNYKLRLSNSIVEEYDVYE